MANKKIEVTPHLNKCLEVLKEAAKSLPEGDLKTGAERALSYLARAFEGEPQPIKGYECPTGELIIKT